MAQRQYKQVDVFSSVSCRGNPLAVVLDGDGLDDAALQQFANWTNLSETTFVLPPRDMDADYRVRIFTPSVELPFAGHPTIGTCHAWLESGGVPKQADMVMQECGAGLIRIRREGELLAFAVPPLRKSGPLDDELLDRVTRGFGIAPTDIVAHQWLVNGPQWMGLLLPSAEHVLSAEPNRELLAGLDVGLIGPYPKGQAAAFEVRAFAMNAGVVEDPVTGSLNAGIAQWLIGSGRAPSRYVAAQGTRLGRAGRVHVSCDEEGTIWIGGHSRTIIDGVVVL